MKKFWIDYSTSMCIEAETADDALQQFWNCDPSNLIGVGEIQVDGIEEVED